MDLVECKCCLSSIHNELSCLWLELPWDVIFSIPNETDLVFSIDIHLLWSEAVVFVGLCHGESECLAHHIVEWHCEEVTT